MEEKKLTGKRKYHNDYDLAESGGYVYKGGYFRFDMTPPELSRMKWAESLLALAIAAAFLSAGFLNNEGSRVIYVILPYVLLFLPLAFMISDVCKIVTVKGGMTRKQYDHSVVQLKHVTVAAIVLSCVSIVGDLVFILTACGSRRLLNELLFLAACVVILLLDIVFIGVQRKASISNS